MANRRDSPDATNQRQAKRRSGPDTAKYREQLAERLRITRQLLEPRQVETARKLGITQSAWFRYEHNIREVDAYVIGLFAIQYRVTTDWLILGKAETLDDRTRDLLFSVPEAAKYLRGLPPPAVPHASQQTKRVAALEKLRKELTEF
jgi:transcriptional regulator with XRE-family HTH domain